MQLRMVMSPVPSMFPALPAPFELFHVTRLFMNSPLHSNR